jgi:hypothetical protein
VFESETVLKKKIPERTRKKPKKNKKTNLINRHWSENKRSRLDQSANRVDCSQSHCPQFPKYMNHKITQLQSQIKIKNLHKINIPNQTAVVLWLLYQHSKSQNPQNIHKSKKQNPQNIHKSKIEPPSAPRRGGEGQPGGRGVTANTQGGKQPPAATPGRGSSSHRITVRGAAALESAAGGAAATRSTLSRRRCRQIHTRSPSPSSDPLGREARGGRGSRRRIRPHPLPPLPDPPAAAADAAIDAGSTAGGRRDGEKEMASDANPSVARSASPSPTTLSASSCSPPNTTAASTSSPSRRTSVVMASWIWPATRGKKKAGDDVVDRPSTMWWIGRQR